MAFLLLFTALLASAQQRQAPQSPPANPEAANESAAESEETPANPDAAPDDGAEPAAAGGVSLAGQVNASRGEARRNENVQVNLVDNNAQRDANQRVGATATIIEEFRTERNYFSGEFGNPSRGPIHAAPQSGSGFHGNVFWSHNNSLFSARSFFQVGTVQPARENQYGAAFTTNVWKGGYFTFSGSQDKNRGMVNGNVIIPALDQRTPLTTNPVLIQYVNTIMSAFPNVAPNRPDIAANALNTNAPQTVNTNLSTGQLNQKWGARDSLLLRYAFTGQQVKAFQFVRGQNPDTTNKSHASRITWNRAWSAATVSDFSFGFDRQGTLLAPAEGAVGPIFFAGFTILGPFPFIPIDRAQNQWITSFSIQNRRGHHAFSAGAGLTRRQFNGAEADGLRMTTEYRGNFGNDVLTNVRMALPSAVRQSFGDPYRGFRNWDISMFAGDHWAVSNQFTLSFGVRYEPNTRPVDVTRKTFLPYDSDWNNLGGNLGFAYRLPGGLGVLRGAGAALFGQIYPATFGQVRMNPPHFVSLQIPAPNLANGYPFAHIDPTRVDPNTRSQLSQISPELATPYSFQYNFSWDAELHPGWRLQLGYVGSRSRKLFSSYTMNRALPVAQPTVQNVNDRRPNPNAFEIYNANNGSNGYYDAARVTFTAPNWHGLTINSSYWFSKAIDLGGDFNSNAALPDRFRQAGQQEQGVHGDMKALSDFDQPHSYLLQANYDLGRTGSGWFSKLWSHWNVSSVYLLKSGTPFMIDSGSDGPGFGNVDGTTGDRPMLLDTSILGRTVGNPDTAQLLLPRSAFRYIDVFAGERAGTLGRNAFRKGKIANTNMSISRAWTLPSDVVMTFRAESINFTNTPQFAEPGRMLASPNFAQITNTLNDGRTFRFTLRFSF